jgi:AcrR family transcriptional regulator
MEFPAYLPAMPRLVGKSKLPDQTEPARERIIVGARDHFLTHGFRGVTMDDLAAELGMSKKTLYAHFPSKAALLEAVIRDKLGRAEADFRAAIAGKEGAPFAVKMQALLGCVRAHTEELQPSFMRDMRKEAPEIFALVQTGRRGLIQRHFGQLLAEGRKAGAIRRDIPADLLVEMLMGTVDAIVTPQRLDELSLTPKAAILQILSVYLTGITTEEGRKNL